MRGFSLLPAGLAGETMSGLCREFGISRKTGYKIFERYQAMNWSMAYSYTRREAGEPRLLSTASLQ
jgi:hypothetical protein